MRTPLELDPKVLGELSASEAVQAFRLLLCAEASKFGVPATAINVPAAVNVADGGVDATVETGVALPSEGLISAHQTRFQIKTGDAFKPWQKAAIRKELFGDAIPGNRENLGSAVRACLDHGGRYVLVCFGQEIVAKDLDTARQLVVMCFQACGYSSPKVDVLGQSQLLSVIEQYPGLVRRLRPGPLDGFRDHLAWSQDAEMSRPFQANQAQSEFIGIVRSALRGNDGRHVRVCGEAGIGKTRLVMEATSPPDLAAKVLYCQGADVLESGLLHMLELDSRLHAILIVDECDTDTRARLADRLSKHSARVRVVSIYQTPDPASGVNLLLVPPLEEAVIVEIIRSYEAPQDVARRWAGLCDGSPRVAHVIGENLRTHPEDILKPASTNNVWDRYVQGLRPAADPRAQQSRIVLRFLALFQRFGFEMPVNEEAKAIAEMVYEADSQITWYRFAEIIRELRERRILQGQRTLYITPKALHIWLWAEWWDTYEVTFEIDVFVGKLKGDLLRWFIEMWRYAHRSQAATRIVEKLLSRDGPFADGTLLRTELGADFLLALTDASPEAVLGCLERTVGAWSHDELLRFTTGRDGVRFALERIIVWRNLFARGARILLALAAAENERWSNNSTGIFAGLFSPARGPVAPTEASPEERYPVLVEAITSPDPLRRQVGLKAAERALQSGQFSRMSGAEYQGLRLPPKLWMPKTWGELFDAYRRVWRLLEEQANSAEPTEREAIANILVSHFRGLVRFANLADECLATMRRLVYAKHVAAKSVISECEDILQFDRERLTPEHLAAVTQLRDDLVGSGFSGRLRRFIGMRRIGDSFEEGKRTNHWAEVADGLADEAIARPDLLHAELAWLVTQDAENAGPFGSRLAKRDSGKTLLSEITAFTASAGNGRSLALLGEYLRVLFETDRESCERELDRWAANPALAAAVPELTWRSGMSDRGAHRLLSLLRGGAITTASLRLFSLGRAVEELSEPVFHEMALQILDDSAPAAAALAVELVYHYYEHGERRQHAPADLLARVLTNSRLFEDERSHDQSITGYVWLQLARLAVQRDLRIGPQLLALLIEHADKPAGLLGRHDTDVAKLAAEILQGDPEATWRIIVGRLSSDDKFRVYTTLQWLGGGLFDDDAEGLWISVELARLWAWVDERVEDRAWMVATAAPRTLDVAGSGMITRELLRRYGDRDDVRRNLLARFVSGSWWGNASDHFGKMKHAAEAWQSQEKEPRIREWLDVYIATLAGEIERSRIHEERGRL